MIGLWPASPTQSPTASLDGRVSVKVIVPDEPVTTAVIVWSIERESKCGLAWTNSKVLDVVQVDGTVVQVTVLVPVLMAVMTAALSCATTSHGLKKMVCLKVP